MLPKVARNLSTISRGLSVELAKAGAKAASESQDLPPGLGYGNPSTNSGSLPAITPTHFPSLAIFLGGGCLGNRSAPPFTNLTCGQSLCQLAEPKVLGLIRCLRRWLVEPF